MKKIAAPGQCDAAKRAFRLSHRVAGKSKERAKVGITIPPFLAQMSAPIAIFFWLLCLAGLCTTRGRISNPLSILVRSFSMHILPNLSHLNSTVGHSDATLAIGLPPLPQSGASTGTELSPAELLQVLPLTELNSALEQTMLIASHSADDIKKAGWKVVHQSDLFSLYKRRSLPNNQGPVEYLMTGKIDDVSPRTFLHSQINVDCRSVWDKTMKEMSAGSLKLIEGVEGSEDSLYYRTKWPWPLKDRDYTLVRRCREFEEQHALVFCSRSTDMAKNARKDGVIRVDNYWCHSALFSTSGQNSTISLASALPSASSGGALAAGHKSTSALASVSSGGGSSSGSGGNSRLKEGSRGHVSKDPGGLGHSHAQTQRRKKHVPPPNRFKLSVAGMFGKKTHSGQHKGKAGAGRSDASAEAAPINCLDMPGMVFISVFCDDQKVPLHPRIVDMIASQVRLLVL